jgi:hypothetical protein
MLQRRFVIVIVGGTFALVAHDGDGGGWGRWMSVYLHLLGCVLIRRMGVGRAVDCFALGRHFVCFSKLKDRVLRRKACSVTECAMSRQRVSTGAAKMCVPVGDGYAVIIVAAAVGVEIVLVWSNSRCVEVVWCRIP